MKIRALSVEAKDGPFELKELDLEEPGSGRSESGAPWFRT
jgi:hypothetical protein